MFKRYSPSTNVPSTGRATFTCKIHQKSLQLERQARSTPSRRASVSAHSTEAATQRTSAGMLRRHRDASHIQVLYRERRYHISRGFDNSWRGFSIFCTAAWAWRRAEVYRDRWTTEPDGLIFLHCEIDRARRETTKVVSSPTFRLCNVSTCHTHRDISDSVVFSEKASYKGLIWLFLPLWSMDCQIPTAVLARLGLSPLSWAASRSRKSIWTLPYLLSIKECPHLIPTSFYIFILSSEISVSPEPHWNLSLYRRRMVLSL